jgi:amino acid permease
MLSEQRDPHTSLFVSSSSSNDIQVRSGLGQIASEIMSWTILAFIFGSCVAYIIIVGDNFGSVIKDYIVDPLELPPILACRQVIILVLGITIMLPISLQRSMVALAPVSTVALAVISLTTGALPRYTLFYFYNSQICNVSTATWLPL